VDRRGRVGGQELFGELLEVVEGDIAGVGAVSNSDKYDVFLDDVAVLSLGVSFVCMAPGWLRGICCAAGEVEGNEGRKEPRGKRTGG